MPLQKSNLNNNIIRKILKEEYGIIPNEITEINRGTSNIYKVNSLNKTYILKEFQPKRKKETVEKEANIIEFLKNKNIKVPTYIKTKNNKNYTENAGRVIILQEYVDGYTIGDNEGDYDKVIESARILGKLVKELSNYLDLSDENIIEKQFSRKSLEYGIIEFLELKKQIDLKDIYKNKIIEDLDEKIKMINEIENNFDFNIMNKITMTNSHGDYCVEQFIYNEKTEPTLIDFEKAKKIPIVWEIMRSYSYIDKDVKNGELNINTLVEYFKEFNKYFKLNEYDLEYASYIYLIQLLRSPFGYKEYIKDTTREKLIQFAFYRTNLCRYLYKNKELISERLIKEIKLE